MSFMSHLLNSFLCLVKSTGHILHLSAFVLTFYSAVYFYILTASIIEINDLF